MWESGSLDGLIPSCVPNTKMLPSDSVIHDFRAFDVAYPNPALADKRI